VVTPHGDEYVTEVTSSASGLRSGIAASARGAVFVLGSSRRDDGVEPSGVEDLLDGLLEFLALYALLVDVELVEEGVVQESAGVVGGVSVQLLHVVDEGQVRLELLGSDGEGGTTGVAVGFDAGSVFSELVEAGADLVLGQALFGEVDEPLFSGVEFGQSRRECVVEFSQGGLLFAQGLGDRGRDGVDEVFGQAKGAVVADDVVLDECDGQVWQVALTLLSSDADVVLVLGTSTAAVDAVDQLVVPSGLVASVAVELLLQVMGVGSVAPRRR